MRWVQTGRRAEFSRRNGRKPTATTNHALGTSRIGLVASLVLQQPFLPPLRQGVGKSIQPTRLRYHTGSGSNTPGYYCSFLRLAYYLDTVLSAVLTTIRRRGERFPRIAGVSSTPLRFGSLSPTFFNEVVMVGIPSSIY